MWQLFIFVLFSCSSGFVKSQEPCFDKMPLASCKYAVKIWSDFCENALIYQNCMKFCGKCKPDTGGGGSTKPAECGISKVIQKRIVNGAKATPNAWPWMASLQLYGDSFCGGTLIAPTWGNGLDKLDPTQIISIYLGVHSLKEVPVNQSLYQPYSIKRIISHPNFPGNAAPLKDIVSDIALLELDRPAVLNDRVGLACLPPKGIRPKPGKNCFVSGWGLLNYEKKQKADILHQAKLPVVKTPNRGCHNNPEVICAGYGWDINAPVACSADSGGPFVCQGNDGRWVLDGVSSFNYDYCKYYTAFVPVEKYRDWIDQYITN